VPQSVSGQGRNGAHSRGELLSYAERKTCRASGPRYRVSNRCTASDDFSHKDSTTEQSGPERARSPSTAPDASPDALTASGEMSALHQSALSSTLAPPSNASNAREGTKSPILGGEAIAELLVFTRFVFLSVLIGFTLCSVDIILGLVVFTTGSVYAVAELFGLSVGARTAIRILRTFAVAMWILLRRLWHASNQKIRRLLND
jgi:hypothetical protein